MLDSFRNPPSEYRLPCGGVEDYGAFFDMSAPCVAQRAKLLSSAAHLTGSGRTRLQVMLGSCPSLEQMKVAIDRLQCLGVSAPAPDALRQGAPSGFYRSAYKLLSDYAARLGYALSQGKHRAQVALFLPQGLSMCAKDSTGTLDTSHFDAYCECLLREHLDYDVLTAESIEQAAAVDQRLMIAGEEYELLILPPVASIGLETALKIAEFVEDGGALIATNLLPVEDVNGDRHEEVRAVFSELFARDPLELVEGARSGRLPESPAMHRNGDRVFFFESREPADLAMLLSENVSTMIRPEVSARWKRMECGDLACVHRGLGDSDIFFFANSSSGACEVQLTIRCAGAPYQLDLETGEALALRNCTQRGGRTILLHRFEPHGSLLLYFAEEPALAVLGPVSDEMDREMHLPDKWEFEFEPAAAVCRQHVEVPSAIRGKRVFLRAQCAANLVEFIVNGNSAGVRPWPPFEIDITELVQPGSNLVEIRVAHSPSETSQARPIACASIIIR